MMKRWLLPAHTSFQESGEVGTDLAPGQTYCPSMAKVSVGEQRLPTYLLNNWNNWLLLFASHWQWCFLAQSFYSQLLTRFCIMSLWCPYSHCTEKWNSPQQSLQSHSRSSSQSEKKPFVVSCWQYAKAQFILSFSYDLLFKTKSVLELICLN